MPPCRPSWRRRGNVDDLPDAAALIARVQANPADLGAKLDLANALIARREYEPALEQLLEQCAATAASRKISDARPCCRVRPARRAARRGLALAPPAQRGAELVVS